MENNLNTLQEWLLDNTPTLKSLPRNTSLSQRFAVITRIQSEILAALLDEHLLEKLEANLELERKEIERRSWKDKPWLKYGKYSLLEDPTDNALLKNSKKSKAIASLPLNELKNLVQSLISHFGNLSTLETSINDLQSVRRFASTSLSEHGKVISPPLSKNDISLCLHWANASIPFDSIQDGLIHLNQQITQYDTVRLLSARAAELATQEYFIGLGQSVTDIAITQLSKGDTSWKDFDLLVNNLPVDVKNARRSYSSPESYVEHCIPSFKNN